MPDQDHDHLRRQVIRQLRYGLNVKVFQDDRVPLEGPWDVALTNGLLAVCAHVDPAAVLKNNGSTKPARELLVTAVELGLEVDAETLTEGLEISQPFRHGRADDEWLALRLKHLDAVVELDALPGLDVLGLTETYDKVDSLIVELFHRRAWEWVTQEYPSPKEQMDAQPPDKCDECLRLTFIPLGYDNSGRDAVPGFCIACGYQRDEDDAWEMYMDREWYRWNAE